LLEVCLKCFAIIIFHCCNTFKFSLLSNYIFQDKKKCIYDLKNTRTLESFLNPFLQTQDLRIRKLCLFKRESFPVKAVRYPKNFQNHGHDVHKKRGKKWKLSILDVLDFNVLVVIFSFLNFKRLVNIRIVSKKIMVIADCNSLWFDLYLKRFEYYECKITA
jgi:hypothetical protein